jgi:hypothetical protein
MNYKNLFFIATTVLTIGTIWTILNVVGRKRFTFLGEIEYRQSDIHEIIKDYIPRRSTEKRVPMSQSRNHVHKNMVKVVMVGDEAYWVMDNTFFVARTIDGRIDPETAEPLDIINMPEKDLNKMLDILDSLKMGSGANDSSGSGDE